MSPLSRTHQTSMLFHNFQKFQLGSNQFREKKHLTLTSKSDAGQLGFSY